MVFFDGQSTSADPRPLRSSTERSPWVKPDTDSVSSPDADEQLRGSTYEDVRLVDDPDAGLSLEERAAIDRRLVRKLDWRLIPWLTFLYLICFLDRYATTALVVRHTRLTKPKYQHRQCQNRRPTIGSAHDQRTIQCNPLHFLRLLLCLRTPHQCSPQALAPEYLSAADHGFLGHCHGHHGSLPRLRRTGYC